MPTVNENGTQPAALEWKHSDKTDNKIIDLNSCLSCNRHVVGISHIVATPMVRSSCRQCMKSLLIIFSTRYLRSGVWGSRGKDSRMNIAPVIKTGGPASEGIIHYHFILKILTF